MINWKNIVILGVCFLIGFQTILYSMEKDKAFQTLSTKAQIIKNFLDSFDIESDKKNEIVEYFSQDQAGIPICINNSHSPQQFSIANIIPTLKNNFLSFKNKFFEAGQTLLLGFPYKELYDSWYLDTLRKNKRYLCTDPNHPECNIDNDATEILNGLRHKTKIPQEAKIPILKRNFSTENISLGDYHHGCGEEASYDNNGKLYCYIAMNSQINHDYPLTISFSGCHEIAHLKRGTWEAKKELLIAKGLLGVACLLSYPFFKDKSLWLLLNIEGLVMGQAFLKPYFRRKEEKACDLRAIELTGSANGVEDFFSLKFTTIDKFRDANWIIQEIKMQKEDKPQEYFWIKELLSDYYSPAERVRYCQEYAEQLKNAASDKNSYTYFCRYKIRKNKQPNIISDSNTLFGYKIRRDSKDALDLAQ